MKKNCSKKRSIFKKTANNSKKKQIKAKHSKAKKLIVKKIMTDEEIKSKESEYFSKKDFKHIMKKDIDVYYLDENGKEVLLAKFRKKVIPKKLCKLVMENLKKTAQTIHDNRGLLPVPLI